MEMGKKNIRQQEKCLKEENYVRLGQQCCAINEKYRKNLKTQKRKCGYASLKASSLYPLISE
jgi:hypothetical protein